MMWKMFFMTDFKNYYPYIVWNVSSLFHNIYIRGSNVKLENETHATNS